MMAPTIINRWFVARLKRGLLSVVASLKLVWLLLHHRHPLSAEPWRRLMATGVLASLMKDVGVVPGRLLYALGMIGALLSNDDKSGMVVLLMLGVEYACNLHNDPCRSLSWPKK